MVVCQLLLLGFLFSEALYSEDMKVEYRDPPKNATITLARFMCAIFLHVVLTDEIKQGFAMMKFSNNHWWLFDSWSFAYLTGFVQMLTVILTEVVNIAILNTNHSTLDIIMNFMALVVLVEFDNMLFQYGSGDTLIAEALKEKEYAISDNPDVPKRSFEDLLKVRVTTSHFAKLPLY